MGQRQETMELRDLVGPYKGRVRLYLRHAGENAIASGFAELPDKPAPPEVKVSAPAPEAPIPSSITPLPEDFPAREDLEAYGVSDLEFVPTEMSALVAIPGIGKATAKRILSALGG